LMVSVAGGKDGLKTPPQAALPKKTLVISWAARSA
jgi:hypothetical protein